MKIVNSVVQIYRAQKGLNEVLKSRVDKLFNEIKDDKWHYTSRIKSLNSFALKIETGRFSDPKGLEDFFACVLVVENIGAINKVKNLVKSYCKILEERPKSSSLTDKES